MLTHHARMQFGGQVGFPTVLSPACATHFNSKTSLEENPSLHVKPHFSVARMEIVFLLLVSSLQAPLAEESLRASPRGPSSSTLTLHICTADHSTRCVEIMVWCAQKSQPFPPEGDTPHAGHPVARIAYLYMLCPWYSADHILHFPVGECI